MSRVRTAAVAVTLAGATVASACVGTGCATTDTVSWRACEPALTTAAQALDAHAARDLQCARLEVPLNYATPDRNTVSIAVSRIRATSGRKRGVLLVNPGGPGLEGRSMPAALRDIPGLADWDIVGVDVRGTGASTHPSCFIYDALEPPVDTAASDQRSSARDYIATISATNTACTRGADGPLLSTLTASTAARDLDRVRAALGVDTISYFGASWGTELGLAYRTLFPQHLDTMTLDSPVYLGTSLSEQNRDIALALARHPAPTTSPGAPRTPPDTDRTPLPAPAAPPLTVLTFLSRTAYSCNTLGSAPAADVQWRHHTEATHAAGLPISTRLPNPTNSELPGASLCSGWPTPGQHRAVADTGAPLLLIGHRDETVTPYSWASAAARLSGGNLLTLDDDKHGSAITGSCTTHITRFLTTATSPPETCTPMNN